MFQGDDKPMTLEERLVEMRAARKRAKEQPPRSMARYALEGLAMSAALTAWIIFLLLFVPRYPGPSLGLVLALLIVVGAIFGSSSDPLTWIAIAILFLVVILFCIRKFMQG